jgi:hypothetical protein
MLVRGEISFGVATSTIVGRISLLDALTPNTSNNGTSDRSPILFSGCSGRLQLMPDLSIFVSL